MLVTSALQLFLTHRLGRTNSSRIMFISIHLLDISAYRHIGLLEAQDWLQLFPIPMHLAQSLANE